MQVPYSLYVKHPLKAISWIDQHLDSNGIHAIKNIFPDRFAAYFKIHLPYAICEQFPVAEYRYEPDTIENLNKRLSIGQRYFVANQWESIKPELLRPIGFKALAEKYDMPYDIRFSMPRLLRKIGSRPVHIQRNFPYELALINQMIHLLGAEQLVGLFVQGNHHFEQIDPEMHTAWFKQVKMERLASYFQQFNEQKQLPFPLFPTYLFDESKEWCLSSGKLLGGHYVLMACSEDLAVKVEAQNWSVLSLTYDQKYA